MKALTRTWWLFLLAPAVASATTVSFKGSLSCTLDDATVSYSVSYPLGQNGTKCFLVNWQDGSFSQTFLAADEARGGNAAIIFGGASWEGIGNYVAGSASLSWTELLATPGPIRNGVAIIEDVYNQTVTRRTIPFVLGVPFEISLSFGSNSEDGAFQVSAQESYTIFEADGTTPIDHIDWDVPLSRIPEPRSTPAVLITLAVGLRAVTRRGSRWRSRLPRL